MAALNKQMPDNLPGNQLTSRMAEALPHTEETEETLYELFPFGLVHEILELSIAPGGAPDDSRAAAPAGGTGFPAALP